MDSGTIGKKGRMGYRGRFFVFLFGWNLVGCGWVDQVTNWRECVRVQRGGEDLSAALKLAGFGKCSFLLEIGRASI